jgi:hypothetical protein
MKVSIILFLAIFFSYAPNQVFSMDCLKECLGGCYEKICKCCGKAINEAWIKLESGAKQLVTKWNEDISEKTFKLCTNVFNDSEKVVDVLEKGSKKILEEKMKGKLFNKVEVDENIDFIITENRKLFMLLKKENEEVVFKFLKQNLTEIIEELGYKNISDDICAYIVRVLVIELKKYTSSLSKYTIEQIVFHLLSDMKVTKKKLRGRGGQYMEQENQTRLQIVPGPLIIEPNGFVTVIE